MLIQGARVFRTKKVFGSIRPDPHQLKPKSFTRFSGKWLRGRLAWAPKDELLEARFQVALTHFPASLMRPAVPIQQA